LKTHLGRRPFSAMELHTLYNGYIYSDTRLAREQAKHWHFWLPLIAYYSGAYSDEIGCLTLDDLYLKIIFSVLVFIPTVKLSHV